MATREAAAAPIEPQLSGRGSQRTAPRAVVRAHRSAGPRHHRALGVLQGATSRSSAVARPSSSCRTRSWSRMPTCGGRPTAAANCGRARTSWGCGRSSWRPAISTRRSGSTPCSAPCATSTRRARRVGRPSHRGYDIDRVVETARLGDRVYAGSGRLGRRTSRGWLAAADVVGRPTVPAPRRGERFADPRDAGGEADDRERHRHVPGYPRRRRAARGSRPDEPVRAGRPDPHAPGRPRLRAGWGGRRTRTSHGIRTSEATAKGYAAAIEETLGLVRDPAHKAMAIWGKALADMGADEADLEEGLGRELRAGALRRSAERHRTSEVARSCVARLDRTASDLRIHPRSPDIATALSVTERTSESLSLRRSRAIRELSRIARSC